MFSLLDIEQNNLKSISKVLIQKKSMPYKSTSEIYNFFLAN